MRLKFFLKRELKKEFQIYSNLNKAIIVVLSMIILLNFTAVVYADDGDDDDSENIINEINFEQEDNIINSANPENQKPTLNSRRYVILDRKSGLGIYGKDENKQTAMASTTNLIAT